MSAVLKAITPFINKDLLCEALKAVGCKYTIQGNSIITDRHTIREAESFEFTNGRFSLSYYSHNYREDPSVANFLKDVEGAYNEAYRKQIEELERLRLEAERKRQEEEIRRLEEERKRIERERQEFVEKQRQTVIANAKAQGYSVREEKVKEKIKLVLVRTTY
jgi:valyl-tRNA synthetase